MFRKLLLAGAAAAALCIPGFAQSKAQAGSFGFDVGFGRGGYGYRVDYGLRHAHQHHFHVLYRDCWCGSWRCYGDYCSEHDAYRVADSLRWRGYNVRVSCD